MRDDGIELDPEESSRLVALALLAVFLIAASLLVDHSARAPLDGPLAPGPCTGDAHRTESGGVACGPGPGALSEAERWALGLPIDLNRATEEDLRLIPGLGAKVAARIVEHRGRLGPFTSVKALDAIPGVGRSLLERLRAHATASTTRDPGSSARSRAEGRRARSRSGTDGGSADPRRSSSRPDG